MKYFSKNFKNLLIGKFCKNLRAAALYIENFPKILGHKKLVEIKTKIYLKSK